MLKKLAVDPIYKVLSLFLVVAMVFGCLPVFAEAMDGAGAATADTTSGGMDTDNLYFYSYDKKTSRYTQIQTEYKIDNNGYLHFLTNLAGDIVVTDTPLGRQAEKPMQEHEQNPETGGDGDSTVTHAPSVPTVLSIDDDLHNPSMGGVDIGAGTSTDAFLAQEWEGENDLVKGYIAAITAKRDVFGNSQSSRTFGLPLVGVVVLLVFIAVVLWALIPRKSDELVPIEEYRRENLR